MELMLDSVFPFASSMINLLQQKTKLHLHLLLVDIHLLLSINSVSQHLVVLGRCNDSRIPKHDSIHLCNSFLTVPRLSNVSNDIEPLPISEASNTQRLQNKRDIDISARNRLGRGGERQSSVGVIIASDAAEKTDFFPDWLRRQVMQRK